MILLQDGPGGRPALYEQPERLIFAETPGEVAPALDALDVALAEGRHVAGFMSYEAGYALEPRLLPLMPANRRLPLMLFGVFDAPRPLPDPAKQTADRDGEPVQLSRPVPGRSAVEHGAAVERVLSYIRAGDCYQVNLTFPFSARQEGGAQALYEALGRVQPVRHGAVVDLPGAPGIVSLSPELFFRMDAGGRIETHPMKGTRPRDADPARDADLRRDLQGCV
jgi:para-aminobenzoate synthetase component 1